MQTQNKSTRFVEYISLEVLPQLHSIVELEVQSQVLKTLGEACMNSSEVKQPNIAIENIYQKLMVSMSYVYTLNLLFSWTTELSEKQVILRNYTSVGKQGPSKITS